MATNTGWIDYNEGAAPATPAASKVRLYAKTDGLLYSKDDAGTETLVSGGAGSGGISSGTSFPGGAASNDLFYRTDRDLLYFYDGTRWVTVSTYRAELSGAGDVAQGQTNTTACYARSSVHHTTYDLYLMSLYATTYVATTNNGTNYWTVSLGNPSAAQADFTNVLVTFNTSAHTANNWTTTETAINAAMGTSRKVLSLGTSSGKTGTPGGLYLTGFVEYRLIG